MFVPVPYSSEFEYICTYCMDSIYDVLFLCSACVKFILCKQCVIHGVELGKHRNNHGLKPIDLGNYVLFDLSGIPQRRWTVRFALQSKEQECSNKVKLPKYKHDYTSPTKECLKSILKVKLSTEERRRYTISSSQVKYYNIFMTICRRKSGKTSEEFEQLVKKLNRHISKFRAKQNEKINEKRQKISDAIQRGDSPEKIAALKGSSKLIFKLSNLRQSTSGEDIRRSSRVKLCPKSKDISQTRLSLSKGKEIKVQIKLRKKINNELSSCIILKKRDLSPERDINNDEVMMMEMSDSSVVGRKKIELSKRVTRSKKHKIDKRSKRISRKVKDDPSGPRKIMNTKQKQSVKQRLILLKNRASELKQRINQTKISITRNKESYLKILRAKKLIDPKIIEQDLIEIEKYLCEKNVPPLNKTETYKGLLKKKHHKSLKEKKKIPRNSHIVGPAIKQWRAWEEMQLLDAIEKFGYGNWKAIAEEMQDEVSISAKDVAEHYFIHYVLFDVGDCTLKWKKNAHLIRKMLDRQAMFLQRVPDLSGLIADSEHNFKFNYKPKRDDFEPDFDSDFENVVANMLPDTENVTKLDMKLQIAHMEMYKLIIRDRQYSKYIIREYELLRKFMLQYPRKKLKIIDSDSNLELGAFRVFLRFASREHLQKLYLSLHKEFFLKLMIRILLRFKNLGIVSLDQLLEYKRCNGFANRDQHANLFFISENELLAQDYETLRTILELECTDEQEIFIEEILPYLLGKMEGDLFGKLSNDDSLNGKGAKKAKFSVDERIEQWISFMDTQPKSEFNEYSLFDKLSNSLTKQETILCNLSSRPASLLLELKALILNEFRSCVSTINLRDNVHKRDQRQVELLNSISDDISSFLTHIEHLQINSEV